jgi:hypothetical protein
VIGEDEAPGIGRVMLPHESGAEAAERGLVRW